ncbi:hypothetical protein DYBT9623_03043 [Dyadobacter sp. CECT 9623]|uniref:Uncharacterized protein n=1 Tax=Dyadobacter linearis TaxID=2823330 RepID=A0ABN7R8G8_9BACT|nr:hypothetical protein [Dyadobacter sp. CECT 9623]CAG5070498.1 hypothetical protein DYBT9623_03043 [Dyadobacter sp. CECT 9623]
MGKKIKVYESFEALDADQLRQNIESTLEERWEKFWQLRKFHKELFPESVKSNVSLNGKKKIIISKPEWI